MPDLKKKVIDKNLGKLELNTEMLLQLECDNVGILTIVILKIQDIIDACRCEDENGLELTKGTHFECDENHIERIRGTKFPSPIDAFWITILLEFVNLASDLIHLVLFFAMIVIAPWRFIQCVKFIFNDKTYFYFKEHERIMGMIQHTKVMFDEFYNHYFEPLMNDMVKNEYQYHNEKKPEQYWRGNDHSDLFGSKGNFGYYFSMFSTKLDQYMDKAITTSQYNDNARFDMSLSTYDTTIKGMNFFWFLVLVLIYTNCRAIQNKKMQQNHEQQTTPNCRH